VLDAVTVLMMHGFVQDPIVTEMAEVKGFTAAEGYHQQYLERGGRFGKAQSAKKSCDDPIRCYG